MTLLVGSLIAAVCVIGIALTILGLPGIWLMVLAAASVEIWQRGTFSLWTIAAAMTLALLAEVVELISGALGAQKAGASKRALLGATGGGIAGALAGTVLIPIPIVGTILGGALGAAIGAAALEMTIARTDMRKASAVAAGAFAGRLVATILKAGFAAAVAVLLGVAAFV